MTKSSPSSAISGNPSFVTFGISHTPNVRNPSFITLGISLKYKKLGYPNFPNPSEKRWDIPTFFVSIVLQKGTATFLLRCLVLLYRLRFCNFIQADHCLFCQPHTLLTTKTDFYNRNSCIFDFPLNQGQSVL